MSNILNEDIDRLLDELELKRDLTFVDESPLGRGGFGTVYRARCASQLSGDGLLLYSVFSHSVIHSNLPRCAGDYYAVKTISITNMTEAERRKIKKQFAIEASTMNRLK